MKKLILFSLVATSLFLSCKKENEKTYTTTKMAILKVNYQTHQLEGGKVLLLPLNTYNNDSIPLTVDYKLAGDFGNLAITYIPTADTIFNGSIVWTGGGVSTIPVVDSPAAFAHVTTATAAPDSADIQYVFGVNEQGTPFDLQGVWSGLEDLQITKDFRNMNAHTAVFLYTPGIGIGDPAKWSYYWIFYAKD